MGHKISKEQIDPGVKDHIMSFVGDIADLETEVNTDIISAVNSLIVDRVDNAENMGKLANAIGEPVTANHSVDEVVEGLGEMLSTFKTNMMNSGVMVESSDKFKSLIDKIATMVEEGSDKGIQFASGDFNDLGILNGGYTANTNVAMNLDFIPNYIFINMNYTINNISGNPSITNMIICNMLNQTILLSFGGSDTYSFSTSITNLSSTGFTINISGSNYGKLYVSLGEYYAIGVGEEDTTLRDSLASILQEEGVSVTEEDDMASLISKVDNEFENKNENLKNTNKLSVTQGINVNLYSWTNDYPNSNWFSSTTWTDITSDISKVNGPVIVSTQAQIRYMEDMYTVGYIRVKVVKTDGTEIYGSEKNITSTNTVTVSETVDVNVGDTVIVQAKMSGYAIILRSISIDTKIYNG